MARAGDAACARKRLARSRRHGVDRRSIAHHSAHLPRSLNRRGVHQPMTAPEPVKPDAFGFAPAFAVDEPAAHTLPFVFNTGHSGAVYPPDFIAASQARRTGPAPLRGRACRAPVRAGGRARRAAPAGELPARLPGREPRAVRTRPADVRRSAAGLCQHPVDARRRRPRHGSPGRRRRPGDLRAAPAGGRGDGADRRPLQTLSSRPARPDPAHGAHPRTLRPHRLPLHAVVEPRPGSRR